MFSLSLKSLPGRGSLSAALAFTAILLIPVQALASTAANTVITNTASVAYSDSGGTAQTPVTAQAVVTVSLVPSAATLSSPPNVTINQGTSATLTYTITSTANGSDTYNLSSSVTPSGISGQTNSFPGGSSIVLGGTTLAVAAALNDTGVTVPYDNVVSNASINGLTVGSIIVVGGNPYTIATIVKNAGSNNAVLTFTAGQKITTVAAVGTVVGERRTFTETVTSGSVTAGTSGTITVRDTAVSATSSGATVTQGTDTVITVNKPSLTVTKLVSTDNGVTYSASGTAPPTTALIYKIIVTNGGASDASSVVISDAVPTYLTYVSGTGRSATSAATTYASATALVEGGAYTYAAPNVNYAAGTVTAGSTLVLFFKATIN